MAREILYRDAFNGPTIERRGDVVRLVLPSSITPGGTHGIDLDLDEVARLVAVIDTAPTGEQARHDLAEFFHDCAPMSARNAWRAADGIIAAADVLDSLTEGR